jgi:hypothetical protein
MMHSPSSEANRHSLPFIQPKGLLSFSQSLPLVSILSQMNPVHILISIPLQFTLICPPPPIMPRLLCTLLFIKLVNFLFKIAERLFC